MNPPMQVIILAATTRAAAYQRLKHFAFLLIDGNFVSGKGNLPAGFSYAGNFAFVSEFTEANTANTESAEVGMGSTADFATIVVTSREFLFSLLLENH